jgi:nucleotide-binding universal stress UspA family protein
VLRGEVRARIQYNLGSAEHLCRQARPRHGDRDFVRKGKVHTSCQQSVHQKGEALLDDLHGARLQLTQRRRQEVVAQRLGQPSEHAYTQGTPSRTDLPARHIVELAAKPKDVVGVARRVTTERCEHEASAARFEELCAKVRLERSELRAQRRMRQTQLAGRGGEATFSGDYREVIQVVIVEPLHPPMSLATTDSVNVSAWPTTGWPWTELDRRFWVARRGRPQKANARKWHVSNESPAEQGIAPMSVLVTDSVTVSKARGRRFRATLEEVAVLANFGVPMSATSDDADIGGQLPSARLVPQRVERLLLALGTERVPIHTLRETQRFAAAIGAELHVIRVVPAIGRPGSSSLDCVARALREAQRVILAARQTRKLCDRILGERLPVEQLSVRLGEFVDQVALRAAELDASTVAVAPSHQRLGAAVIRLTRRCSCAVLVPRGHSAFLTLVAATDLRDANGTVLRTAAQIAAALDAKSIAVHSLVEVYGAASEAELESRRRSLARVTQDIDERFEAVVVRTLDAARGILDEARESDADLIVVGVRREHHPTSSTGTAARVIRDARRSVLVAPPPMSSFAAS